MAQLLVRDIDETIVENLKERARTHGVSAEEEHRRILEENLRKPKKISFEQYLKTMPEGSHDEDFERGEAQGREHGFSS